MGALNHLAEIFFSLLYKIFNNAANKTVPKRSIMQERQQLNGIVNIQRPSYAKNWPL